MTDDRIKRYLVDGNNVMGQRVGWHRDKAGARRRLVLELATLARERGIGVTVVFDGSGEAEDLHRELGERVEILYAGPRSDADTRILELAHERGSTGLVVVTSDRSLSRQVQVLGIRVLSSGRFRRML